MATAVATNASVRIVRAKSLAAESASPFRPTKSGRNGPMTPPNTRTVTGKEVSEIAFQRASSSGPAPKTWPKTFFARKPEPALTTNSSPRITAPFGRALWMKLWAWSAKPTSGWSASSLYSAA